MRGRALLAMGEGWPPWMRYLVAALVSLAVFAPAVLDAVRFDLRLMLFLIVGMAAAALLDGLSSLLVVLLFLAVELLGGNRHGGVLALACLVAGGNALFIEWLVTALRKAGAAQQHLLLLHREISHRTRNDLQLIQTLLQFARTKVPPEAGPEFDNVVQRIGVLGEAYRHLQASPDAAMSVPVDAFLGDLVAHLRSTFSHRASVDIAVTAEHRLLDKRCAVAVGLALNELVTNAMKYAFPAGRGGTIAVAFSTEGDEHILRVSDNGVGLHGPVQGSGVGSAIIRGLAERHGGSFTLSGSDGVTAIFTMAKESCGDPA